MISRLLTVKFMIQILVSEMMFLFPAEKRSSFAIKYPCSVIACAAVAFLFPVDYAQSNPLMQLIQFTLLVLVSMAAMGFCFCLPLSAIVSSCAAGYAVQHVAFHVNKIYRSISETGSYYPQDLWASAFSDLLPFLIVYALFFLTICLYSARHQCYRKVDMRFNILSLSIIFICIGLTRISGILGDSQSVTVSLYAIVSLLMALTVQLVLSRAVELKKQSDVMGLLLQKERQQYERSKQAIDTINIKYHDLKHQLTRSHLSPDEVEAIRRAVDLYGSQPDTGNEVLDVLLAENMMRLQEKGIVLTYVGNGTDLSFMHSMDLYALLGNAIDNAVHAVENLRNNEQKVIRITSEKKGKMISLHVTNYFEGQLQFEEGIPVTTATDDRAFHGFGMKSMLSICEKYAGGLHVTAEHGVFDLDMYLMDTT